MVKGFEAAVDRLYLKLDSIYHKCHIVFDIVFYGCLILFFSIAIVNDWENTIRTKVLLNSYVKSAVWTMDHYLLPILAGTTLLFEFKNKKSRIIVFLCIYILMLYQINAEQFIVGVIPHCATYYFGVGCLMIAAKGRDFQRIGWICVALHVLFMITITIFSVAGLAQDVVTIEYGRVNRHSFGMFHALTYSVHWLSAVLLYCYLKDGFLRWWDYVWIGIITCISALACKAQTSTILLCILLFGSIMRRISKHQESKSQRFAKIKEGISHVLEWSFGIMAGIMILGSSLYNILILPIVKKIPALGTFGARFYFGHKALQSYFPTTLGAQYQTILGDRADAFYIDCGYIEILVRCGVVVFLIVMFALEYNMHQLAQKHRRYALFILTLLAVSCAMEAHLLNISCNPFLLLTFAVISVKQANNEECGNIVKKIETAVEL